MSKEIAQTVSGPKIAWLLAIVAAFAVLGTLATQWRTSEAAIPTTTITVTTSGGNLPGGSRVYTATFAYTPSGSVNSDGSGSFVFNHDADLTFVSAGGTSAGALLPANCTSTNATTVTCTLVNAAAFTNGTVILNFTNPLAGGTITVPNCALTEGTTSNCSVTATDYDVANAVPVNPVTATNASGIAHVFTFGPFPSGITCESDPDDVGPIECSASDVNLSAGLSLLAGPTVNGNLVTVTVINSSTSSTGGTVSLNVRTEENGASVSFVSAVGTKNYANAELRHVDDGGDYIFAQEIANNVRGSRHTACFVAQNTAVGTTPGTPVSVGTNFATNFTNQPPNAYNGPENVVPQSPTANDVSRFISTSGNSTGASCVSWYSIGAGDQILTASYVGGDGQAYDVRWDNDGAGQRGLVKEWNVLEDSTIAVTTTGLPITVTGPATHDRNDTPGAEVVVSVPLHLNPLGWYNYNGTITIRDVFNGSHVNSGGQLEDLVLAGVTWTATVTNACATVLGATSGATIHDATGTPVGSTFVTTGGPEFTVSNFQDCVLGDEIVITITGREGDLGSGTGLTVVQRVRIVFTIPVPSQKQVFLAWAGQRIILEHDWRVPPGDFNGTTPAGFCPFDWAQAIYIKGSGPGNFLPGLGAWLNGSDEARVWVNNGVGYPGNNVQQSQSAQAIGGQWSPANEACISRVLFESEDQGQVDIEAFLDWNEQSIGQQVNITKHAFVIYYMKINSVHTSLVTQVSKPTHNGTDGYTMAGFVGTGLYSDWAPGNPWNSSLDDADGAAEWNVSKDILARVRVTGWFLTTNPSGRPADTSNPLNVLPANRWVMPDDWAQLHGGPIDVDGLNDTQHRIGTAEEFRPYYDLMIAPNNTAGLALNNPYGTTTLVVGVVATGNTGTGAATSPIRVNSCTSLTPGTAIVAFGTTAVSRTVVSCVAGNLVLNSALAAAPAANTLIISASVPFEGPYSLLDILGLAAQNGGNAGAALSNLVAGSMRDTTWSDGDVDAWDAPMPPAMVSIRLRGTGFLKPVLKSDVYYLGTPNTTTQLYPNPYYIQNIPDSMFIPAVAVGGGYLWNSWGNDGPGGSGDGPYEFWEWALIGTNSAGLGETLSTADQNELAIISNFHGAVARDAVVYTDNHGEAMFAANGDFKTDLTACATNALAGGKHCKPGDKVGTATISATADYPDFRGKHFPVLSNSVTVDWLWGGYKDVTVHPGETDQFKYVVFHAMDRDGFCGVSAGTISLHSVLTSVDAQTNFSSLGARYNGDPAENVDFLIDSGQGIIIGQSGGGTINDGRQFATGVTTFSVAANNPATSGILEFPLSPLSADGQTDECQAWVKISNSLLGIVNVLTIAHDDEGNIGFDRVIDLTNTTSYTLNFRWSLITWAGANGIPVSAALTGTGSGGQNPGGNDISASVTAIYGWNAAAQQWLGYFPTGVNVPGANDLTSLNTGQAYWIAITGPSSVTWTVASNVN